MSAIGPKGSLVHRIGLDRHIGDRGRLEEDSRCRSPRRPRSRARPSPWHPQPALRRAGIRRALASGPICVSASRPLPIFTFEVRSAKPFSKGVVDALLDIEARRRDADLPGVAELLPHDLVERRFEVAIVEHKHRRMTAQLHRDALHAVGRELHQMLADRGRAGEADLADHRARQQSGG